MDNEKIQQCLQLAREIFASLTPPKGTKDFDMRIASNPDDRNPFGVNCYLDDGKFTFVSGYAATPELALADMIAKLPPPITAESLRAEAAKLIEKAAQLETPAS